ncbi:unnamed protein product [Adineta steineri]|uniref:ADP ribosyltransferase domain-containing protein n=1 Tax=Adineta steineri TaxID=433720 RepID=A0A815KXM7_9BILA|nr:unnamed protein product [Adineta steineri]CAF4016901.1 unnamed protein product [Adineta steineri]
MYKGKSKKNASAVPKEAENRRRINIQQMQNVLLIWLDSNIDEINDDRQNTITKLRCVVNDIKTYTNGDQCIEFIQTISDNKVCMIVSGSLGKDIMPRVHNISHVDSIFIFCGNRKYHEQWAKDWSKIKGVFTDITPICEALREAAHKCEQNAIPMSFVNITAKHQFIGTAVKCFLYPMLNCALRLMNGDIITRMGFFIGDLHRQIKQLHQEQYAGTTAADTFTVYRGQGLSTGDFEQMSKIKGGLISFNNFLSTSTVRKISLGFAQYATINPDQVGVLFILKINPAQSTTPFASIAGLSDFEKEEEVLFSMHSVFRIQDIKQIGGNNRLYEVNLTLTVDNDRELSRLTDYIRQESFPDSSGWYRLGMVLCKMSQFDKAEDIYQILLDQTKDDEYKAPIYGQLGIIKRTQGKYQEALAFFEQSLAISQKTLSLNDPQLAVCYNNIGAVHSDMGNYPKALSCFEKALEIRQQLLPPNHPDLAASYNNTGVVYENMGNYSKARTFYEHAIQIGEQSLPLNHPTLQKRRNNLERVKNK